MNDKVQAFRKGLDPKLLETVDALRALIMASDARLTEGFKWNAPSFAFEGEDRITLGLERKGGVRIVLHRGAKPKDAAGFHFEDEAALARWPDPDRGIVLVTDASDVANKAAPLQALFARWIAAAS